MKFILSVAWDTGISQVSKAYKSDINMSIKSEFNNVLYISEGAFHVL